MCVGAIFLFGKSELKLRFILFRNDYDCYDSVFSTQKIIFQNFQHEWLYIHLSTIEHSKYAINEMNY